MSTNKWMAQLTKNVGKIAADIPSPSDHVVKLPSPSLNWVVGNGGITRGKTLLLYGPESGGKSLLMQLIICQLQKDFPEGICVLFDTEYSFNPDWFSKLGGDLNRLVVRQTNDPLEIFDYIEGDMLKLIQDGCPIVGMAIDSVKAIRYPKDIKEKSTKVVMGGGGASYLGPALKGMLPVIREHFITTILVQQVYEEMDEYKKMQNPYVVPDGRALKHASDYMLEVTKIDTKAGRIEDGKNIYGGAQQVGHKVRVRGKKNRVGAPFRAGEFALSYTQGIINVHEEIFELAKSLGVIQKPNNITYQFGDFEPVRGEANMKEMIRDNNDLAVALVEACDKVNDARILDQRNQEFGYVVEDGNMLK